MLLQEATTSAHALSGSIAEWVWLIPLLPFVGFLINGWLSLTSAAHVGPKDPSAAGHGDDAHGHGAGPDSHDAHSGGGHGDDPHATVRHRYAGIVSIVGPAVLLLSFGLTVAILMAMLGVDREAPFIRTLFSWIPAGELHIDAALQVDPLSMVMTLVVTGVGTLIHFFSVGYMQDDPGYPRYFAYLNLFVSFMLVLVLGASYPVLFVG